MKTIAKYVVATIMILNSFTLFSVTDPPAKKSGQISGIITDFITNQPIEYANISLFRLADSLLITGCITNIKGEFIIENIAYGSYFLSADFIGYKKIFVEDIEINNNTNIILKPIQLSISSEQLGEVEIAADRNYVDFKVDKKVINVSQHINANGGTAAEVLENVPSVNVDIEGNVTLRGSGNFTVLIDGRPSPLSSNDLLKQIPANIIENIEIITNPSAKYDPDGTAGIINIVMKKNSLDGKNGMVSVNSNSQLSYGGTANFNIRKNKINFFVNSSYNKNRNIMTSTNNRKTFFTDTTGILYENTKRIQAHVPWRINTGLDYYVNNKNLITFSATYGGFGFFRDFETKYESFTEPENIREYSVSNNLFNISGVYYAGNFSFEHKFNKEDSKIVFETTAWQWIGNNTQESFQQNTDNNWNPNGTENKIKTINAPIRNTLRAKLDFNSKILNGTFETGLQTILTDGDSKYMYYDYNYPTNDWTEDITKTNNLDYYRALHSGYATYNNKTEWFEYQIGLRLEYTDRIIKQQTTNENYRLNLFNYYPTLHLSKQLTETQQIQLSYSKRIDRPQTWELNTFPDYSDRYNLSYGNPLLKPEDINSYEFNYIQNFKKIMLSTGLYYRETDNTKIMAQEINSENPETMIVTYFNLDKTQSYGIELNLNYDVTDWFTANIGGNYYRYQVSDEIAERTNLTNSNNWDTRVNTIFRIKKSIRLQFTYTYNGPGINGQGYQYESNSLNAAIKYSFSNNKASLTFNVQDIFATDKFETKIETSQFYSYFILKSNAPVFRLNFSYIINNYKRRNVDNNDYQ